MKAVLCKSYGPPENLVLEEIESPSPGEGQVLIDVYSTDAKILAHKIRVLQDDEAYFPSYDAMILYRAELQQRAPRDQTLRPWRLKQLPPPALRVLTATRPWHYTGADPGDLPGQFLLLPAYPGNT